MAQINKGASSCRFKTILKKMDALDMQINRIKNQLTELRMMIGEQEVNKETPPETDT